MVTSGLNVVLPFTHIPLHLGPCQFPTLGFVVSRYAQVKAFVPETFWYIHLSHKKTENGERKETIFNWKRGHLFDQQVVVTLYAMVRGQRARVTKVTQKTTKKW
jgi:DNA topoisomerase-3